jgi:ABC-type sugar transport system ATPase subunit
MDEAAMIKARDLYWKFNQYDALAGVSFQMERGEILSLLGLNHARKIDPYPFADRSN